MSTDDQIIEKLKQASQLMKSYNWAGADELFQTILAEGPMNPNVEKFSAAVLGMRAECLFAQGKVREAIEPAMKAVAESTANEDTEGAVGSLVNLYEMYRYLDEKEKAVQVCDQLLPMFEQLKQETATLNYKKQAKIVRNGEPLNRIVIVVDGVQFELDGSLGNLCLKTDQLPALNNKKITFNFLRNKISIPRSRYLVNVGRELGVAEKYKEAALIFQKAYEADPFDPSAKYEEGLTRLYLEEYEQALECFKKVIELAPGWFQVNHDMWLAQALIDNKIDQTVFRILRVLEEGDLPPHQKLVACEKMMYNVRLPIANLQHAKALLQLRRVEDAEKTLRTALTYTDELDVDTKTRLLFNLATVAPTREEKDRLLEETIKLGGNLTSKAMAIVTRHIDHIRDGPVKQ